MSRHYGDNFSNNLFRNGVEILMNHLTICVYRGNAEIDLDVDYNYHPATLEQPEALDVLDIRDKWGNVFVLTAAEAGQLIKTIQEKEATAECCPECDAPTVSGRCTNSNCQQYGVTE